MIKFLFFIRRRPDLTPEEFHRYWRTEHRALVESSPVCRRYIRKYTQSHVVPAAYEGDEDPPFDGVVELWFDSAEDMEAFVNDPEYLATIRPDEETFTDLESSVGVVAQEEPVF